MTSMHEQRTAMGPAAETSGLAVAASGVLLSPTVSGCSQDTDRVHLPDPGLHRPAVTWLVEQRERPVHLIVVRPNQSGSQHPHARVTGVAPPAGRRARRHDCWHRTAVGPDRPAAGCNRVVPDRLVSLSGPDTHRSASANRRSPTEFGRKLLLAADQRGFVADTQPAQQREPA